MRLLFQKKSLGIILIQRTEYVLIGTAEYDQLIAILDQGLETPVERFAAAFIRARRTQEHPRIPCPLVSLRLGLKCEAEHARHWVLKGIKGDFGGIVRRRMVGNRRG